MEDNQNAANATARIYIPSPLQQGDIIQLPPDATRHIQVLRMQPQDHFYLFNGHGGQFLATITTIRKNQVQAQVGVHIPIEREASTAVTLLIGIPANERMDFIIEKTTELGVTQIYPLLFSRSVIKLNAERAKKKLAHWQAIANAACEQSGRNRIPHIHPVMTLSELIKTQLPNLPKNRRLLSFQKNALPWTTSNESNAICILSGPEGGLTPEEETTLISEASFVPYSLGARILRADTAPIATLSSLILY